MQSREPTEKPPKADLLSLSNSDEESEEFWERSQRSGINSMGRWKLAGDRWIPKMFTDTAVFGEK